MIEALLKLLPDWLLPLLLGVALWFGVNYLYLTGFIAERTQLRHCEPGNRAFCSCVVDVMLSEARPHLALWSSTFGLYDAARSPDINAAKRRGQEQCR